MSGELIENPEPLQVLKMAEEALFLEELREYMRERPKATACADSDSHNAAMVQAAADHYAETGVLLASDGSARDTKGGDE